MEDILHSAVRACSTRRAMLYTDQGYATQQMDCSSMLEPRLDCLVLEDVGHNKAMMMRMVTTLDFRWQSLSSWMASTQGKAVDERLMKKVLLGVMGSLRDMCLQSKSPPRELYVKTAHQEPKLASAFFVHSGTGDVLSLLPFI